MEHERERLRHAVTSMPWHTRATVDQVCSRSFATDTNRTARSFFTHPSTVAHADPARPLSQLAIRGWIGMVEAASGRYPEHVAAVSGASREHLDVPRLASLDREELHHLPEVRAGSPAKLGSRARHRPRDRQRQTLPGPSAIVMQVRPPGQAAPLPLHRISHVLNSGPRAPAMPRYETHDPSPHVSPALQFSPIFGLVVAGGVLIGGVLIGGVLVGGVFVGGVIDGGVIDVGRQTWPGPSAIVMHVCPPEHSVFASHLISHCLNSGPRGPAMPKNLTHVPAPHTSPGPQVSPIPGLAGASVASHFVIASGLVAASAHSTWSRGVLRQVAMNSPNFTSITAAFCRATSDPPPAFANSRSTRCSSSCLHRASDAIVLADPDPADPGDGSVGTLDPGIDDPGVGSIFADEPPGHAASRTSAAIACTSMRRMSHQSQGRTSERVTRCRMRDELDLELPSIVTETRV